MEFKEISREAFFATVGQMDVHPMVDERTLKGRFYTSIWKLRNQKIVGKTISDSHGIEPGQYFVVA